MSINKGRDGSNIKLEMRNTKNRNKNEAKAQEK